MLLWSLLKTLAKLPVYERYMLTVRYRNRSNCVRGDRNFPHNVIIYYRIDFIQTKTFAELLTYLCEYNLLGVKYHSTVIIQLGPEFNAT